MDFPDGVDFDLTPGEAQYLQDRINQRCPGTLLARLMTRPARVNPRSTSDNRRPVFCPIIDINRKLGFNSGVAAFRRKTGADQTPPSRTAGDPVPTDAAFTTYDVVLYLELPKSTVHKLA